MIEKYKKNQQHSQSQRNKFQKVNNYLSCARPSITSKLSSAVVKSPSGREAEHQVKEELYK